ncbi:MAG: hypothetical protein RI988_3484 [Pseudomonadota bacterium]|jgi:hypothetical protein
MTYPKELQDYYDAHDAMMDAERQGDSMRHLWPRLYGLYKVARYAAVRRWLLPETPEFG